MKRIERFLHDLFEETTARMTRLPAKVWYDIPYVCQFAHADDVEAILKGQLSVSRDPNWKLSGAVSLEEYADWSRAICGMACLSMILRLYGERLEKPLTLAKDAALSGVYIRDAAGKVGDMRYAAFTQWIARYGLDGVVCSRLSLRRIKAALAQQKIPIVSVGSSIYDPTLTYSGKKGGHLVVVTGYDDKAKTLTINNPSGFSRTATQKDCHLHEDVFLRYFAGRGILVAKM